MLARAGLLLLFLATITLGIIPFAAEAQYCDAPAWEGKFFNNVEFSGLPIYTTCNSVINFNWGLASPASGVNADNFSVRWTSVQNFAAAGTYTFTLTVDGGVRFYVNGSPVINSMTDTDAPRTLNTTYSIQSAGSTAFLTLELVNWTGNAQVSLNWSLSSGAPGAASTAVPPGQSPAQFTPGAAGDAAAAAAPPTVNPGQPWIIEYFNNLNWEGTPVASAQAPANGISRNYDRNAPVADGSVGEDGWSARWTRPVDFPAGTYTFTLRADDGARVYIGDTIILEQPRFLDGASVKVSVQIPAGQHIIRVEHFDEIGFANLFLTWEPPVGTTLFPDGCNGETAGINGSAAPCPGRQASAGATMMVTVRAGPLHFRPGPARSSGSIRFIHRGETYVAVGRSADNVWVELVVDGETGWSMTEFLSLPQDINVLPITDGSLPAPTPFSGTPIATTTINTAVPTPTLSSLPLVRARALGHVRIRSAPNTNADRIGGVAWGEEVTVIGLSADGLWLKIEANGIQGWSSRPWYEIIEGDLDALPVTE